MNAKHKGVELDTVQGSALEARVRCLVGANFCVQGRAAENKIIMVAGLMRHRHRQRESLWLVY